MFQTSVIVSALNMVKVISQETFDGVVKENMEEFEMDREEAVKEAISQFEQQGVNLNNIVTSGKVAPLALPLSWEDFIQFRDPKLL